MSVFIFIGNYQNVKYLRLMADFKNLIRTKNLIPRKHPHLHTDITLFSRFKEIKDALKFIHGYQIKAISVCGLRTRDTEKSSLFHPYDVWKDQMALLWPKLGCWSQEHFPIEIVASCILRDQLVQPDPFDQNGRMSLYKSYCKVCTAFRYCRRISGLELLHEKSF